MIGVGRRLGLTRQFADMLPADKAEVIEEFQPDPTDAKGQFGLVVVKAVKDMPKPVTLADAKTNPKLKEMSLVTSFRLSVQPVRDAEWKEVCKMGGLK